MARVNITVEIYKSINDWRGSVENSLVGTYDSWIEEGSSLVLVKETQGLNLIGKGTLFLWDDVDLDGCYFIGDGKRREILQWYRYADDKKRFNHIEVIYQ